MRSELRGQRPQFIPIEAGNDHLAFETPCEHQFLDVFGDLRIFQFNIQQASGAELVQDVRQQRDGCTITGVELAQLIV